MKLILITLLTLCSITALTACNTIEGIGEDIGAAGKAIDDSAEENKAY